MNGHGIRTYDGASAIITGGASGIGRALGQTLARMGCDVTVADIEYEQTEKTAAEIRDEGGKAVAAKLDVTDFAAVEHLVQQTAARTGRLDYMFNNAGIAIGGSIHLHSIEDWENIIAVNLGGVTHGVQAALKVMKEQGFGHIVNTASMAGLIPTPHVVSYCATKHAVVGLSKSLRSEVAEQGIRVSVLCPGIIRTPILDGGKHGKIQADIPIETIKKMWECLRPMPPDVFARKALKKVAKNKAIIICPCWWKPIWWFHRLVPSFGVSVAERCYRKVIKRA